MEIHVECGENGINGSWKQDIMEMDDDEIDIVEQYIQQTIRYNHATKIIECEQE